MNIPALCLLLATAGACLTACNGFNLDPGPGRAVPKADPALTAPPPELRSGTSR